MNRAERREVFVAIIRSSDPSLTARDRLTAALALDRLGDDPIPVPDLVSAEIAGLDGDTLDGTLDALLASTWDAGQFDETYPELAARIEIDTARRVDERVRQLVDPHVRELEIEEAARERAARMYRERAFDVIDGDGDRDEDHEDAPSASTYHPDVIRAAGMEPGHEPDALADDE